MSSPYELNDFRRSTLNIFNNKNEYDILSDCLVMNHGLVYKDGGIVADFVIEQLIWLSLNLETGHQGVSKYIRRDPRFKTFARWNVIMERLDGFNQIFNDRLNSCRIENVPGVTLQLMHPFHNYEYGHFFDTFQKIVRVKKDLNIQNILISNPKKITDFEEHMRCLELDGFNLLKIGGAEKIYRCEKLLYIYPVASITTFTPSSLNKIRDLYFSTLGIQTEGKPRLKLFLTRKSPLKRHLINHDELSEVMLDNGVEVLDGSEPLSVIVDKFSRASHIAAVHGSILCNIIFCDENTKFIEFCPASRVDTTFFLKLKLSQDYTHRLVETDESFNMRLDQSDLINFYNS